MKEGDFDRTMKFAEIMVNKIEIDENFKKCRFSDEVTFMLNGSVSLHTCKNWYTNNIHI